MNLQVFPTAQEAAAQLADRIASRLRAEPDLVLGLPTGRTPLALYVRLAELAAAGAADFSRASTFNLDEFLGLRPEDPGSFRAYMERQLFRYLNLNPARVHFLDGSTSNPEEECARYEATIDEVGGIDLQILGIGANGHIGFNEPGDWLPARTHRVALHADTRRANAAGFGGDPARVPAEALSMGVGTILGARSIVLLANGQAKATAVERMVRGPLTPRLPASFLQLHGDVTVMLDEAAAEGLRSPGGR